MEKFNAFAAQPKLTSDAPFQDSAPVEPKTLAVKTSSNQTKNKIL